MGTWMCFSWDWTRIFRKKQTAEENWNIFWNLSCHIMDKEPCVPLCFSNFLEILQTEKFLYISFYSAHCVFIIRREVIKINLWKIKFTAVWVNRFEIYTISAVKLRPFTSAQNAKRDIKILYARCTNITQEVFKSFIILKLIC